MSQPDNTLRRIFCDCGQRAVAKRGNAKMCQRCADLCTQGEPQKFAGFRERDPGHVGWLDVKAACNAALFARGINPWAV